VVSQAWQPFCDELAHWSETGRKAEFWWRDDDAGRPDPALARLFELCSGSGVPLALAAVPDSAVPAAFADMPGLVTVIQHGVDHRNRAQAGGKKTEFPEGAPIEDMLGRLAAGYALLRTVVGGRASPVLAPPWNRIPAALAVRLEEAGYQGLSTFGVKKVTNAGSRLRQVNTHVDIIDWKGGRGFVGIEPALAQATRHLAAKREGATDGTEPTGWLTHHAVHDEESWRFMATLFDLTRGHAAVRWLSAQDIFVPAT
jgi:hypothetical protein